MDTRRHHTGLFLILAALLCGLAPEASAQSSILYRGRIIQTYPYAYNGCTYWQKDEFSPGSVEYCGRLFEGVLLNIDVFKKELQTRFSPASDPIMLSAEKVGKVEIEGLGEFRHIPSGSLGALKGYCKVVFEEGGFTVYEMMTKTLGDSIEGAEKFILENPGSKEGIYRYFDTKTAFYFVENGDVTRVSGASFFKKRFKGRKKEISRFVSSSRLGKNDAGLYEGIMKIALQ